MILLFDAALEAIAVFFQDVLITLLAGLYVVVSDFYQIFLVLARTNIFEQSTYQHLTEKVYVILAVVMLFVLAYNFITLIIDPDKNKGGKVVEDVIKNAVTSLILIVLCPTLFGIAFDLQDAVLNQGIISKFFTVESGYDASGNITTGGRLMAGTTFSAFFTPNAGVDAADVTNESDTKVYSGDHKITRDDGTEETKVDTLDCGSVGSCTLEEAIDFATVTGNFMVFHAFAKNLTGYSSTNNQLDLNFLLALVAGGFLIFTIASFCFDLALRVIKLAFYQIISPLCIAFRVVPGKEGIFKNWWGAVSKTFLSVFVRIFIMNLAVFLLVTLKEASFWEVACPDCSFRVNLLAYAFLVMGLLMFIKQSTKLIDEIFGFGDINMGFGAFKDSMNNARDTLKSTGVYGAGAAIGAGAKGMKHGLSAGVKAFTDSKGKGFLKRAGSFVDIGGKALRRGASASMRSISKSTGGFGFAGFKEDYEMMRANKDASVQSADLASLAWKDKEATVKQIWDERKDLKLIKKRIQDKINQKKAVEQDALYKAALNAKIKLDKIDADIESDNKAIARMEAEARLASEKYDRLLFSGASDEELAKAQDAMDKVNDKLANFRAKAQERVLKRASLQADFDTLDGQLTARGMSFAQIQSDLALLDKEISALIEESADFKWTQVKEDFSTRIAQDWTGVDQARAQDLVMQYNDRIKEATKKIVGKYGSKIVVDMESSLKKNAAFAANARAIADAISNNGFTVEDITSIAQRLSSAHDWGQIVQILPEDVRREMGISEANWAKMAQSFSNVVSEPYTKEVNKAVADAVTSGDPKFSYGEGAARKEVFARDADVVLADLDSKDVSRRKYAYDVLHFELYGTAAPKDSAGRKALEDELRKRNAANDRAKAAKQVLSDVSSANTTGNNGSKK